jgi:hypothetical protein
MVYAEPVDERARNFPHDLDDFEFPCYRSGHGSNSDDPSFPYHVACEGLLKQRLVRLGRRKLEHETLYRVFLRLNGNRELDISYGDPPREFEEHWECRPGEEIFVANPMNLYGWYFDDMIEDGVFAPTTNLTKDLSERVKKDPFKRLPNEILLEIIATTDTANDLLSLACASWPINSILRASNDAFWWDLIQTHLDWFFELHERLLPFLSVKDSAQHYAPESLSLRRIFAWAGHQTLPRLGIESGRNPYLLNLANRRRIWEGPLDIISRTYDTMFQPPPELPADEFGRLLLHSKSKTTATVTHDPENRDKPGKMQKVLWLDDWEDTYGKKQHVEAFFDRTDGFLIGLAVTSEGGERRIVGSAEENATRFVAEVAKEDWICGIVLHIPPVDFKHPLTKTSPKGVTVLCCSGKELEFGETDKGHPVRALVARPGKQAVGLVAQLGSNSGAATFARLGLLVLRESKFGDHKVVPHEVSRSKSWFTDELLWGDDGTRYFGAPLWNHPEVSFGRRDEILPQPGIHKHMMSFEPLVLGVDEAELRKLEKISIFMTSINDGEETLSYEIIGLGAEFSDGHPEGRRLVGLEGKKAPATVQGGQTRPQTPPRLPDGSDMATVSSVTANGDVRIDLWIDGPGGEFVTDVAVYPTGSRMTGLRVSAIPCHLVFDNCLFVLTNIPNDRFAQTKAALGATSFVRCPKRRRRGPGNLPSEHLVVWPLSACCYRLDHLARPTPMWYVCYFSIYLKTWAFT